METLSFMDVMSSEKLDGLLDGLFRSEKPICHHIFHWKVYRKKIFGTSNKLNKKINTFENPVSRKTANHLNIYHIFTDQKTFY